MNKKDKKFDPSIGWFSVVAGIGLVAIRFFENSDEWSSVDVLKIFAGAGMIVFGIVRIIKDKKDPRNINILQGLQLSQHFTYFLCCFF